MSRTISVVIVGAGGYGDVYLKSIIENKNLTHLEIKGVVDPKPERSRYINQINAPIFDSLEKFYKKHDADLAVISSPMHFHCDQTILALKNKTHVLCEKPTAVTVDQVNRMIEEKNRANRIVAIGYQWSYSESIQLLKKQILNGDFGSPLKFKSLCLWPRDKAYYARNSWAGKKQDHLGNPVLDSPMNNAMAHFLHNMLFLLGERMNRSAEPIELEAQTFKANKIETYDTAALRLRIKSGAQILFYASHATPKNIHPIFKFEFEKGEIVCNGPQEPIFSRINGKEIKELPHPDKTEQTKKLWDIVDAIKTNKKSICGLEATRGHTICVNETQNSMENSMNFPEEMICKSKEGQNQITWVMGLEKVLLKCYEKTVLPDEMGVKWAKAGKKINLSNRYGEL